jgi:PAS domain S-box-containing protein
MKANEQGLSGNQPPASEDIFRVIFENSAAPTTVINADGTLAMVNEAYCALIGFPPEELIGSDWLRNVVEEDAQRLSAPEGWRGSRSGSSPAPLEKMEFRFRHARGDLRQGLVSLAAIAGSERLIGTFTDITERKKHEADVERLSRLYASLSQINQAIVRAKSREELFAQICRAAIIWGKFKLAWVGWVNPLTQSVEVLASHGESGYLNNVRVYADDRPEGSGPTGTCIREGRTYVCNDFFADPATKPWRERAKTHGFAASIAVPIRFRGAIAGALTVYGSEKGVFGEKEIDLMQEAADDISFALDKLQDLSDHQQAEAANHQLMVAIDQAVEAIVFADAQGTILFVNQGFETATGYTREEILGKNPRLLKSGKQSEAFYKQLWQTISSGRVWQGHFTNRRKDGSLFEEDATISPIRNLAGEIVSYVAVKRDVTREVQLERQLIESQKMEAIGQLAGGVAHDYNNILAANMMSLDLLHGDPSLSPQARELVLGLQRGEERAADLTRQLLLFSRRQTIQTRKLELNALLAEELKMLRRLLGEHIDLVFEPHGQKAWIQADAGMMEQVIMNLCINARDAMPKGGQITVTINLATLSATDAQSNVDARAGRFACLSVEDVGTGIPEEIRERIFEPFFTTKEAGKGTGLGLATAYGIVKQHQGWIEVRSEIGKGSQFLVYIPVVASEAQLEEAAQRKKAQRGTETILVVEDEPTVRKTIAACLHLRGYRVLEASDGVEAKTLWSQAREQVDLLLTDMVMPGGISGLDLAEACQASRPGLPTIILSGYSAELAASGLPSRPGLTHLLKPCNATELSAAIRKALEEARKRPA